MEGKGNIFTKPGLRTAWHLLFWGAAVVFMTMYFGHQQKEYLYTFYFVGILLPVTMGTSYIFLYYLIPRYLERQQYAGFAARALFTLLGAFYLGTLAIFIMLFFFIYGDGPQMDPSTVDIYFLGVGMFFIVLLAIAVKLLKLWFGKQQSERILEKEKLQAELNMLKSQIHPHFLFNTLNNIYALALQKSDAAPGMLVKLSEILHYILYECEGPYVPIEKEITLLHNYISLERIRYDDRLELSWSVPEDLHGVELSPMILLPFVENAFKHGASKVRDRALVTIVLSLDGTILEFSVVNNRPKVPSSSESRGGLGLTNVRQRLELTYPDRHILAFEENDESYSIHLRIETDHSKTIIK